MYAKLLIKAAILLLVINIALIGIVTDHLAWQAIAIFNLISLFVLLFQERSAFHTTPATNKRILFAADVFGRISLGIGIIIAGLASYWGTALPPLLAGILGGGLFYLLSVAIFGLVGEGYWKDSSIRIVGVIVALIILGVLAQRLGILSVDSVGRSYNNSVAWWQRTLQSVIVDREVDLPDEPDEEGVVFPSIDTGDVEVSDDDDANVVETGSLVEPEDTEVDDERVFDQLVRSNEGTLTFANFLPILFDTLDIPPSDNDYSFTYVVPSSVLYPSFVLARDYTMIGSNTHPETTITCQTLMVLLGLAQGWDLDYTSATVLDVYRQEAQERGYTSHGCSDRDAAAQWQYLP